MVDRNLMGIFVGFLTPVTVLVMFRMILCSVSDMNMGPSGVITLRITLRIRLSVRVGKGVTRREERNNQ